MLMTLSTAAMLLIPAANNHAQNSHADTHRQGRKVVVVNPDRDGRRSEKKRKDKRYAKNLAQHEAYPEKSSKNRDNRDRRGDSARRNLNNSVRRISVRSSDVRRIRECRQDPYCNVNNHGRHKVVLSFVNATHPNRGFQRTMFELKNTRFESERVDVIAQARLRHLSARQVLELLGCLRYESSKLRAIRILAPMTSERMSRYQLASVFRYSSSIREARRIFAEGTYHNRAYRPTVVATHW